MTSFQNAIAHLCFKIYSVKTEMFSTGQNCLKGSIDGRNSITSRDELTKTGNQANLNQIQWLPIWTMVRKTYFRLQVFHGKACTVCWHKVK